MMEIKATANKIKRTFTLRKYSKNKLVSKYRTLPMSREEFEDAQYNTSADWQDFIFQEEVERIL
jgi:hypothetical protein